MSLLSRLFGGGAKQTPKAATETYEGFTITPEPAKDGARFRVGARIEKEVEGAMKTHVLIRADVLEDIDTANEVSISKARQMIDEQGARLFN